MSRYLVVMEIAGPFAMFTRPDTGGTPTSYPAPTWSAAKGAFESIARLASGDAWIKPTRAELCRPIGTSGGEVQFQRYATNYGGPLRKGNQIAKRSSFQLFATVLSNVCYRLHGEIVSLNGRHPDYNPRHYLQDLFERRLKQGRCHRTPCLGWSEFTASYWGQPRDGRDGRPLVTEVDRDLNLRIPAMLVSVFDSPIRGDYAPRFQQNAEIKEGVLEYAQ